jgi:hypothetical protein
MVNNTEEQQMLTQDELKKMTLNELAQLIRKECANVGQYGEEYLAALLETPSEEQEDAKLRCTHKGAMQALDMAVNSGAYRSENSQAVKKELVRRFKAFDTRQRNAAKKAQAAQ